MEEIKPKSIFFPPKETKPSKKKGIRKVYFRDNGKYFQPDRIYGQDKFVFCHYCGSLIPISLVTRDHKVPAAKGGTAERNNILPSCITCNTEKGHMDYIDYLQYRYRSGRTMSQEATKNFENHLK